VYETEFEYFEQNKSKWCAEHGGQFVVIRARQEQFFPTEEEAYFAGRQAYDDGIFLLRRVLPEQERESLPLLVLRSVRKD